MSADVENAVDVEDDHELTFEPVHSRRHARKPDVEIDRVVLATRRRQLERD